ncbi:hypothetical protein MT418_003715 [Batrachochytrium dendrobatidis]
MIHLLQRMEHPSRVGTVRNHHTLSNLSNIHLSKVISSRVISNSILNSNSILSSNSISSSNTLSNSNQATMLSHHLKPFLFSSKLKNLMLVKLPVAVSFSAHVYAAVAATDCYRSFLIVYFHEK